MAITKNLVVTLKNDTAKPKEKMFVYRDDVGIEMIIELKDFDYSIDVVENRNNIQKAYALFRTPSNKTYRYTNIKISNEKLVFTFSQDIVNVMQEIGEYELQFQLYDKENNRLTIPSYNFYVKEPLTIDGELVDTAVVDESIIVDFGEEQDYIFIITDGYIKTNWKTGDLITKERLNKVENALSVITDAVNSKVGISQLHNHENKEILDTISANKINEWDNKSTFSGNYNDLTNKPTIPTLNGYATEQYVNEEIKKIDVTEQLTDYAKKSELHSHTNKTVLDGITTSKIIEWNNKSTFDGNYNSLTNKPTIPTKVSELTNDEGYLTSIPSEYITESELNSKGYLTEHQDISGKVDKVDGHSLVSDTEISRLATLENYDDAEVCESINEINMSLEESVKFEVVGEGTTVPPINGDSSDLSQYAKKSDLPIIVQETGDSENLIMSQKAVTDFVRNTIGANNNSKYERVDSIDEMIDTSKKYILNSTNTVWVYKEVDGGEPTELYEPSKITLNQRYSGTPGTPTVANGFFITDYIPIVNNGNPKIMITDNTGANSTSNTPSLQKCTPIDENFNSLAVLYCYGNNVKQNNHWYATKSDKTLTLDLSKRADGSAFEYVDKIKYVRIDVRASGSSITSNESSLILSIKDPNNTTKVFEWIDSGQSESSYVFEDVIGGLNTEIDNINTSIDNINSSLEDVENDIEDLKQSSGGSLVPNYVISESESVAEKVLDVRNSDSFVMACASDLHTTGEDTSAIGITHMGMAMNEINKITQLDLVVIFGDIIVNRFDNNYKKGFIHVKKSIDEVRKAVPYIQMQGNHDEISTDTTEQGRQKYYAYIGANNVDVTTDYSNKFRNYGYKDFDNYKMRVIYLNSTDVSDGEITTDVNISYEQFNWFINTALDFSTKDSEWKFIVCTHHPLNWASECMPKLLTILDSYKGKTSGSINVSGKSIAYNFTAPKATLIAHFHGHLHNFRSETLGTNNVLSITIPNACFGRNNEYGTSSSYSEEIHAKYGDIDKNGVQRKFNKTSDSSDDTAFNIVVIDWLNSMIHCFNYGAGIDRIINFDGTTGVNPEPPSGYTNVIETVGYTNDIRLSTATGETKSENATGYTTTGFIEVKEGDIIRTSGINMKKSAERLYCSYAIFDSNKTKTGTGYLDVIDNTALKTSFDGNGNLTLTCGVGFDAVKSYLRLCGFGDGANLIVTVNQEIS